MPDDADEQNLEDHGREDRRRKGQSLDESLHAFAAPIAVVNDRLKSKRRPEDEFDTTRNKQQKDAYHQEFSEISFDVTKFPEELLQSQPQNQEINVNANVDNLCDRCLHEIVLGIPPQCQLILSPNKLQNKVAYQVQDYGDEVSASEPSHLRQCLVYLLLRRQRLVHVDVHRLQLEETDREQHEVQIFQQLENGKHNPLKISCVHLRIVAGECKDHL